MRRIFLWLYDALWFFALPWVYVYLWLKGRQLSSYRQRINERFGFYRCHRPVDIWIHAVSMGEVVATRAMVQAFLDDHLTVLITTMTPTGSAQVQRMWDDRVEHQYCPYDFSWAIERFLSDRKPKLLVIFETEIWPGILSRCAHHHIPVVLANARISMRSYPRYLKTRWLWQSILSYFSMIIVQSELDKCRFINIGAIPEKLKVAGNLKFMQSLPYALPHHWLAFQTAYPYRKLMVWGSTHDNEEALLLAHWKAFSHQHPQVMLVVVPRHPERFGEVFNVLNGAYPGKVAKFSDWPQWTGPLEILLVDRMGELSALYHIAHSAFVGGSLVPIGGHNILEPMSAGVPVITGPYMHNQQDMVRILNEHQALIQVETPQACIEAFATLLDDDDFYQSMSQKGKQVIESNQNALSIHLEEIKTLI